MDESEQLWQAHKANPYLCESWRSGGKAFSIIPHGQTVGVWRVQVTSRGRVYACTWANRPERGDAIIAWHSDRKAFRPFDTVAEVYLA